MKSAAQIEAARAMARRVWADPEFRARHAARKRAQMQALNQDPAFVAKANVARARTARSEETRLARSQAAERRWADPAEREAHRQRMLALLERPEYRDVFQRAQARTTALVWGVFHCPAPLRPLYRKLCQIIGYEAAREAIRDEQRRTAYGDERYDDDPRAG